MRQLDIILRTCDNAEVHQVQRIISAKKSDITLRCINSLALSLLKFINENGHMWKTKLWIIDDHSDIKTIDTFHYLLKGIDYEIIPTPSNGNNCSMETAYTIAMANCNDLIFFIEDDYLCVADMFSNSIYAYNTFQSKLNCPVVITPVDEQIDYDGNNMYATRIVTDESFRRWRTTYHTTFTLLTHKYVLVRYWEYFRDFIGYGNGGICENNTINIIYQSSILFAPMPALAVHICDVKPMPDIDWQKLWLESEVKI